MYARVTITRGTAKKADIVRTIQERLPARIEGAEGFNGAYMLLDEKTGKGMRISLWDSEDALNASGVGPMSQFRAQIANELGLQDEGVEIYEVIQAVGVPAEVSA